MTNEDNDNSTRKLKDKSFEFIPEKELEHKSNWFFLIYQLFSKK